MGTVPELEPYCGSWVVVARAAGLPVMETFSRRCAEAINQDKATGLDCFEVRMIQWKGAGDYVVIASGVLGDSGSIGIGAAFRAA